MNPTPFTPPNQTLLTSPCAPTQTDYADALDQLRKGAQTQIRTPGALASNLLADALLQYGQKRAQQGRASSGGNAVFPQADGLAAAARLGAPRISLDDLANSPFLDGGGS